MFKQIDTTRIKPRLDRIKGLQKGMQRVHKRIVKETKELVKDLDAYHRELFVKPQHPEQTASEDASKP
jgi:hypothetical protein